VCRGEGRALVVVSVGFDPQHERAEGSGVNHGGSQFGVLRRVERDAIPVEPLAGTEIDASAGTPMRPSGPTW
jgi:hypothetical protein